ncbi:peptidase [Sporolactobacillus terrae]|uniref:Peptidase n=1 Tax=Sporolactobacillus terrae TaxID=269673 RepID=A0ABX5QA62_9BACL|nr:peptidase [Sporolactobacillus terrae]QAA23530.1 peptidase [Sporolactobacillus terrae]QAA26500.1 peptidase [Sporolactobacillus terrae]
MTKLILKSSKLIALNDSEKIDMGELAFDLSQFKIPSAMVIQKDDFSTRVEREKNLNDEWVETGKYSVTFRVYDRPFIEMVLGNGGTEIGSPISIVVEGQDSLPIFDGVEDGEFVPITFTGLAVKPKRVQKKVFISPGKMADSWQYAEIKVVASSYSLGVVGNEAKTK